MSKFEKQQVLVWNQDCNVLLTNTILSHKVMKTELRGCVVTMTNAL
jgi:hypothetical protein